MVFLTKSRHKVLADRHLERMEEIMRAVCACFQTDLVEFNGENNHIHPLADLPTMAPSKLVNSLKGVSSPRMRQEFPDPGPHYYRANKLWSGSYLAGSRRRRTSCASKSSSRTRPVQDTARAWRPSQRGPSPPP